MSFVHSLFLISLLSIQTLRAEEKTYLVKDVAKTFQAQVKAEAKSKEEAEASEVLVYLMSRFAGQVVTSANRSLDQGDREYFSEHFSPELKEKYAKAEDFNALKKELEVNKAEEPIPNGQAVEINLITAKQDAIEFVIHYAVSVGEEDDEEFSTYLIKVELPLITKAKVATYAELIATLSKDNVVSETARITSWTKTEGVGKYLLDKAAEKLAELEKE